ncbi:hypothetical protein MKX01_016492 [Papaver californicum]|nr:hypothetical protein MKX01_016492 [Papaver californicum]
MPPKKKLTRYDAAYDHLGRGGLGFTKKIIRTKIDSLLKVYGDDGWVFIEDGAYKVLIDCLLEEQEQLLLKGKQVEEEDQGILLLKEKEEEDQRKLFLKAKEEEEEEDQKSDKQHPRKISTLDEIEKRLTETGRFSSIAETSKVKSRITEFGRFASAEDASNTIEIPESTEVEISDPTGTEIPQRRIRRPCFGFYDSDDNGEDDCEENYVYYETKASLRERMAREGSRTSKKERKSRWDEVGV